MCNLRNLFNQSYKPIKLSIIEKKEIFKYQNIASKETKNSLNNMILSHITGNELSIQDIQNELTQLIVEYYQKKEFNKSYFNFLFFVKSYVGENNNHNNKIFKSLEHQNEWIKVIKLYAQWQNVNDMDYSSFSIDGLSSRERMIAKTSLELKKYKLEVTNGSFKVDNKKITKIVYDLEVLIQQIGAKLFLESLFKKLDRKFNPQLKRYLLPIEYTQEPKLSIPYNYLINISVKNIAIKGKSKYQNDKYINKAIELSKRLAFLYDLQKFHHLNENTFSQQWNISTLHKNILYDNIFRFKQISLDKIEYIIRGIFQDIDVNKKLGFTMHEYIELIRKLYSSKQHSMIEYPFMCFTDKELVLLDQLSHTNPNKDYGLITKSKSIDFLFKPLIKQDTGYLLVDKNYCAWNFYEFLLKALKYPKIGVILENVVIRSLQLQTKDEYKIYHGEYKNSNNEDGQCDAVVETQDSIIFIEVKKKAISSIAMEGDEVKIAEDIIDSFIHSQEQILKHVYSIKLDNEITFDNGDVLKYNNKNLIKVSISLFDNHMLNDKMMAVNILEYFHKIKFNNPTKSQNKKNAKIKSLLINLEKIYKDNPDEYSIDRYDTYFLSLELFMYYLEFGKPINKVLSEIRNSTFSTGDLYYEYLQLLKIKNHKKA